MASKHLRQREDDKSRWDYLEEGPDGLPRTRIIDTSEAARLNGQGVPISTGTEWGRAASNMTGSGAGSGVDEMVKALDENGDMVATLASSAGRRGWRTLGPADREQSVLSTDSETRTRTSIPPEVYEFIQKVAPVTTDEPEAMDSEEVERPSSPSQDLDRELLAAQGRGSQLRFMNNLGRGLDTAGRAIAGIGGQSALGDEKSGDRPVAELLQRREKATKAAENDPSSPESKRAQRAVISMFPEFFDIDNASLLTATEIQKLDLPRLRVMGEQRKQEAAAKRAGEQAVADAKAKAELAEEERREKARRGLQEDQQSFQAEQNALTRENAKTVAAIGAGNKEAAEARKANVPGLEVAPGATPTERDAEAVKKMNYAAGSMRGLINEARALHKAKGTELVGADAVNMRQIFTAIGIEAKDIAGLGALSGPDQALMDSLKGADPTTIENNIKSFFGTDNTQKALEQMDKWMQVKLDAAYKTYGYRLSGAPSVNGPPVPAGKVRMISPDDGKPYDIDLSEAPEAEKNKWKRVAP